MNTQIPGLSGNTNLPLPFNPPFPFIPPFPPSPYQGDPYAPNFTAPVGFPQYPPIPAQHNGPVISSMIAADSMMKESDEHVRSEPPESPEPMELGDKEEGELSNGEIEEESSGLDDYRNFKTKQNAPSYRVDGSRRQYRDDDDKEPVPLSNISGPSKSSRNAHPGPDRLEKSQTLQTNKQSIINRPSRDQKYVEPGFANSPALTNSEIKGRPEALSSPSIQSPARRQKPDMSNGEGNQKNPWNGKSPAQLRIQAQGALLGLAPHNIKYDELVNEGIDPIILKRLYDEIGLKITPTRAKEQGTTVPPPTSGQSADGITSTAKATIAPPSKVEARISEASTSAGKPSAPRPSTEATQDSVSKSTLPPTKETKNVPAPNSGKPLERKDVIARMLAAKAGKPPTGAEAAKSPAQSPEATTSPRHSLISGTSAAIDTEVSAPQSQQLPTESRMKERNKAQTELARQRMEQLKKQGLMRSQTRAATESPSATQLAITASGSSQRPVLQPSSQPSQLPSSLSHPLPDRPPEPDQATTARIPGLFMTSSEPTNVENEKLSTNSNDLVPTSEQKSTKIRAPRKRPRASDFTDEPSPAPQQKQFGQEPKQPSTEHRVIIDISEDEFMYGSDGDSTEHQLSTPQLPVAQSDKNPPPTQPTMRDFPPLFDLPSRNYSHRSTPALVGPQTPGRGKEQADLHVKNMEILAMRQKIAELERRHKEKHKEKQAASRVESPSVSARSMTTSADESPSIPSHQEPQLQPITETGYVETPMSQPGLFAPITKSPKTRVGYAIESSPIAPGALRSQSVLSQSSLDPSQLESMRQKFLRKKEIESGLPVLEAELEKSVARLAKFREEEQRLLAEIEKGRAGKRRLVEELESLGIETSGLTMEELQATKDRLEEAEDGNKNQVLLQPNIPKETDLDGEINPEIIANDSMARDHDFAAAPPATTEESAFPGFGTLPQTSQEAIDMNIHPYKVAEERPKAEEDFVSPGDIAHDGTTCSSSAMDESMGSTEDESDEEQEQSPAGPQSVDESLGRSPEPRTDIEMMDVDERPAQIEEPVPPPDNHYEPAPPESRLDSCESSALYRESSVGSDAYEPPEPDLGAENPDPTDTPPFSPASPNSLKSTDGDLYSPRLTRDVDALTLDSQEPVATVELEAVKDETHAERQHRYFTPYNSPLKLFRAYRYHPLYSEDINGGYRSLTYSHNIDPKKYICAYEAAGGACNDHSCEFQHFRDMSLSDDKILVEMGSLREGKTAEEKEKYVAGLKQTITDMRRDKVKDFNTVATEIVGYRRRFLDDSSRVLAL
ncbi:hypothetical protein FQN55_000530 [Onygenales sp. PD_40]|nr:hypothetical protein FQN55_000530 [Onygenales sp. PD_40]